MKIKIARGRRLIEIASIMVCCCLTSCFGSYNYGVIGIATTRNIELSVEEGAPVRGEACRSRIFVFPTGYPKIKEAIEDALKKGKGDLLGQQPQSPLPIKYFWRSMIANMDAWVRSNTLPPASSYPKIADGTLVPLHA